MVYTSRFVHQSLFTLLDLCVSSFCKIHLISITIGRRRCRSGGTPLRGPRGHLCADPVDAFFSATIRRRCCRSAVRLGPLGPRGHLPLVPLVLLAPLVPLALVVPLRPLARPLLLFVLLRPRPVLILILLLILLLLEVVAQVERNDPDDRAILCKMDRRWIVQKLRLSMLN